MGINSIILNSILSHYGSKAAQGLNVLATFGTNANVFIPGIGSLNGLQAANFLNSDGTGGASVVDVTNGVGRVNDSLGVLGAELVTNGGFDTDTAWTKGAGWTISGGAANSAAGNAFSALTQSLSATGGVTYRIELTVTRTAGSIFVQLAATTSTTVSTISAAGTYVIYGVMPSGANPRVAILNDVSGAFVGTIDNVSVRELTGIHATQATTGNKFTLKFENGKYSWLLDGVSDYMSLSAVPFQMADDYCVIACIKPTAIAGIQDYFSIRSTANTAPIVAALRIDAAGLSQIAWRDDASSAAFVSAGNVSAGQTFVICGSKIGNTKTAEKNGALITTDNTVLGTTTVNSAAIGAGVTTTVTNLAGGQVYCFISIKGTLSAAQRLTLSRFAGLFDSVSF
jgi:hypothetical protein